MRSKIAKELNEYLINDPTYGKSGETREMTCIPYTGPLIILLNAKSNFKNIISSAFNDGITQVKDGVYIHEEIEDHYVFLERRLAVEAKKTITNIAPRAEQKKYNVDFAKALFFEKSIPAHIITRVKREAENLSEDRDNDPSWLNIVQGIWAYMNCIFISKDKIDNVIKKGSIAPEERYVIKASFSRGVNSGGNVKPNTGYIISGVKDLSSIKSESSGVSGTIKQAQNDSFTLNSFRKRMNVLLQELNK